MAYTTEAKIAAFLNETITSGATNDAIAQATDLINKKTGRKFEADATAKVRYFSGNGQMDLPIDDCVEITKVEHSSDYYGDYFEEIPNTGLDRYIVYPINYSQEEVPIRALQLRSRYWTRGLNNQKITAKWGYSVSAPKSVELAATILAAGIYIYNRGGVDSGVSSESIGDYSVSYKTEEGFTALHKAMEALEQFRRINI